MNLYILEVSIDKKEITIVRSNRLLYNLVPHDLEVLVGFQKIFPDYRVYDVEEKHFRDAANTRDKLNLIS
jgi:hypothetical protein